jgi:very-short-patch-repair endonuclease
MSWYHLLMQQEGVAARDQLLGAGMTRRRIDGAVAGGLLEKRGERLFVDPNWTSAGDVSRELRRAIFIVLCSCTPRQRCGAAAFRRSAAALWGLAGFSASPVSSVLAGARLPAGLQVPVEVAVASGRVKAQALFKVDDLAATDVVLLDGLPITTVARTMLDLGQVAGERELERALESALRSRYLTVEQLATTLSSTPKRWGTAVLRSLLAARPDGLPPTESDAETIFVQLVSDAGLPAPERQFIVRTRDGVYRLDFAWPFSRIAVEIDGAETHASPVALGRDLRRQNAIVLALAAGGWVILRFTWLDLVDERRAHQTVDKLREAWSIALAGRR